jgi:Na+-driven multidrug efflux pump
MLAGFLLLPPVLGVRGIWLAVPLAELLTLLLIIGIYLKDSFTVRR